MTKPKPDVVNRLKHNDQLVEAFPAFRALPENQARKKAAMHTAAEDIEAHGQLVGSNCRFLLARFGGGEKRGGL